MVCSAIEDEAGGGCADECGAKDASSVSGVAGASRCGAAVLRLGEAKWFESMLGLGEAATNVAGAELRFGEALWFTEQATSGAGATGAKCIAA